MNIYKCKSTGQLYEVISENARMKDPTFDRWIDCVIYRPLCDSQYEMFTRLSVDFYDKFEVLNKELTEEELEEQRKIRNEIIERWEKIGIPKETQNKIDEHINEINNLNSSDNSETEFPLIKKCYIDFNKKYKIPEE